MVREINPTPSPSSLGYRRCGTPEVHEGKTKKKKRISAVTRDVELEPELEAEQE